MNINKKTKISLFNKDLIKVESQETSDDITHKSMDQENTNGDAGKANNKPLDINSPSVTATMTMYCHIINRLAGNSNVCKTISIALAGAFIGFKMQPPLALVLIILGIILCLMILDSFYIGLKDNTHAASQQLIKEVRQGENPDINPYNMNKFNILKANLKQKYSKHSKAMYNWTLIKDGFKSISIWLFYIVVIGGLVLAFFFGSSANDTSTKYIINYLN